MTSTALAQWGPVGSEKSVRSALLAYPVLMAADILLYQVATVPVGHDR